MFEYLPRSLEYEVLITNRTKFAFIGAPDDWINDLAVNYDGQIAWME